MLFEAGFSAVIFVVINFLGYLLWYYYGKHELAQKIEKALSAKKDLFKK